MAEIEADLSLPPFPELLAYLWQIYLRLRRRASAGFAGAQPIGWADIDSFLRVTGQALLPWELRFLEMLDDTFMHPTAPPPVAAAPGVTSAASAADGVGVKSILGAVGVRRTVQRTQRKGR